MVAEYLLAKYEIKGIWQHWHRNYAKKERQRYGRVNFIFQPDLLSCLVMWYLWWFERPYKNVEFNDWMTWERQGHTDVLETQYVVTAVKMNLEVRHPQQMSYYNMFQNKLSFTLQRHQNRICLALLLSACQQRWQL